MNQPDQTCLNKGAVGSNSDVSCAVLFSRKWEIHDTWSNANAFLAVIWCSMHWWPTTHENDIAIIFPRKNNFEPRESWGTDKVKLDQVYHKQICFCFKIWSACCYLPIIAIKAAFKLPRWRARPSPFLWKVTPMGEEKHTFRKKNAVQFPCRKIAVCNKPHGEFSISLHPRFQPLGFKNAHGPAPLLSLTTGILCHALHHATHSHASTARGAQELQAVDPLSTGST